MESSRRWAAHAAVGGEARAAEMQPVGAGRGKEDAPLAEAAAPAGSARELRYWKARARELERLLEEARSRLIALADALPHQQAVLLDHEPDTLEPSGCTADPLAGWEESIELRPGNAADEMRGVWERLRRRARR